MRRSAAARSDRPGRAAKAAALARLALVDPIELYDRVRARLEVGHRERRPVQACYDVVAWDALALRLSGAIRGSQPEAYEEEFRAAYDALEVRAQSIGGVPYPVLFDADPMLARLAYVFTRVLRPEIVVETGVAFGIVSACVLAALDRNGGGRLLSVDLPPLGVGARHVGRVVPDDLRERWTLYRGTSTRLLPVMLGAVPPVGLFVQDSLFTWRNSTEEYAQVLPHMALPSAMVANCVQHSRAFAHLVAWSRPSLDAVIAAEHKPRELIGVWVRTM